jgi:hypothetical protein
MPKGKRIMLSSWPSNCSFMAQLLSGHFILNG